MISTYGEHLTCSTQAHRLLRVDLRYTSGRRDRDNSKRLPTHLTATGDPLLRDTYETTSALVMGSLVSNCMRQTIVDSEKHWRRKTFNFPTCVKGEIINVV